MLALPTTGRITILRVPLCKKMHPTLRQAIKMSSLPSPQASSK